MIERVRLTQSFSNDVTNKYTLQKVRLRNSLRTIAILIKNGNEKLWPIFEKLEIELVRLEQKEQKLSQYNN